MQSDNPDILGLKIKSGIGVVASHDFSTVLSDSDIGNLVAFIKEGLVDMADFIDLGSKQANGDAANGLALWGPNCSSCHGASGLSNAADVPALAAGNPWETLHKIR